MCKNSNSDLFGQENQTNGKVYEGTPGIERLDIQEIPLEILTHTLAKQQMPVSGGWGYSPEDAAVIEVVDEDEGVHLESQFMEGRSYLEMMKCRAKGVKLAGYYVERKMQSLTFGDNGKPYDRLTMEVTTFLEEDYDFLRSELEKHNGFEGDEEGQRQFLELQESKRIKYEVEGWFDISRFYGKY